MPCTSELNRAQDKLTAYNDADAVVIGALAAATVAVAAAAVTCPLFWTGFGGVACAVALAAAATAEAAALTAILQKDNALEAFNWANDALRDCYARCKKY